MTEAMQSILVISGLLLIDVLTVTTQAAFLHPRLAHLLLHREKIVSSSPKTLEIVESNVRVKASLNLILILERLILGGLILNYLLELGKPFSLLAIIGCLILSALIVFAIGWLIEIFVGKKPEHWAITLTPYALIVTWLMTPFVLAPISVFGLQTTKTRDAEIQLANELKTLVDTGEQEGVLEQAEGKMISSIFDMGNTLTRAIMVPRIDMVVLDSSSSISGAVDAFLATGHSRLPVYVDTVDNIIGVLYAKDLLKVWREGSQEPPLRDLVRPAHFVPEAKRVNELLTEMLAAHNHMSMVVDEYGGIAGLVTLEDIVEEILGEIQDEYDQGEELPYREIGENEYVFQGRVDLDEFNDILASHLPTDDADTLGGYIYSQLGRVPVGGEVIKVDNLTLVVEHVSGRRIRFVRVRSTPSDTKEEERN